jgi:phage terminase small subunit
MALTDRKLAFVEAINEGLNQTDAAIQAGYSEHTAQVQGSRLMNDPDVMQALAGEIGDGEINIPKTSDPLEFLQTVWNSNGLEVKDRIAAARAALPYNVLVKLVRNRQKKRMLKMPLRVVGSLEHWVHS